MGPNWWRSRVISSQSQKTKHVTRNGQSCHSDIFYKTSICEKEAIVLHPKLPRTENMFNYLSFELLFGFWDLHGARLQSFEKGLHEENFKLFSTGILSTWFENFCLIQCSNSRWTQRSDYKKDWILFTWSKCRISFLEKWFFGHKLQAFCPKLKIFGGRGVRMQGHGAPEQSLTPKTYAPRDSSSTIFHLGPSIRQVLGEKYLSSPFREISFFSSPALIYCLF